MRPNVAHGDGGIAEVGEAPALLVARNVGRTGPIVEKSHGKPIAQLTTPHI